MPKRPLQITTRTLKEPDFKFELLPLHSPLLRQSLLVSFPPLIDMLKFSGYPYLIRGQPLKNWLYGKSTHPNSKARILLHLKPDGTATDFKVHLTIARRTPNTKLGLKVEMTLEQAYPPEYQRVQCAFKDSMIH